MKTEIMKDISLKAILIGLLVDIGGTFSFAFVFGVLAIAILTSTGGDIKQLEDFAKTSVFRTVTPIVGLLFTALGGYMSARTAKKAEIKNSLAMGISTAAFGMISVIALPESGSSWLDAAALILTIFFALLGGYICLKTKGIETQAKK